MSNINTHLLKGIGALLITILMAACSSPKVVREPAPLIEMSSPYQAQKDWQIQLDAFKYSDGEGLYFANDDDFVYFGTPAGVLTKALKATQDRWTDQVVWQKKIHQPIVSGPTLYQGHVIIGTAKATLLSLAQEDAQIAWQTELSSEVLSRPVIGNGQVFVRTVDGKLYSINAASGKVNWTIEHQLPNLSLRGVAPVTYDEGVLYVGWETGQVEALDAATGTRKWQSQVIIPKGRTDLERMVDIQAALIVKAGRLFVLGYQGKLAVINPENGNLYWSKDISGFRDFLIDDSALYLVDEDDILYAFDYVNGTQLWKQDNFKYRQAIDLVFYQKKQILLADGQGYIHWIDKLDGTPVARIKHGSHYGTSNGIVRVWAAGNRIYVQDTDGFNNAYTIKPSNWYQFNHPEDPLGILKKKDSE